MRFIYNNSSKKSTVMFIHGFLKTSKDWNIKDTASSNKQINIEKNLQRKNNTILIDIEEHDYKDKISNVCDAICNEINVHLPERKIDLIVTHSYGSFYALDLISKLRINKILLIEPTIQSPAYYNYLKHVAEDKPVDSIEHYKLQNYNDLPSISNIKPKHIVRVHFNINDTPIEHIATLNKITNMNTKSQLIAHYNASHMIHYTKPDFIVQSIDETMRC